MSEGPAAASLAGALLGRYRLERLLGEGGMGVVYAARHVDLGKPAAVKILNERYAKSEPVRARFLREGQATSRIRHPSIVDVYDVGAEGERAYLVMELLDGEDLRNLLARNGALSPQKAADVLVPVVAAVAAAHDAGIIHRDLKPDNVFLSSERNSLAPKVLDFGISKVVDDEKDASLTGTGAILGTPYYMSPEQAQGAKRVDAKADQYSLGVILYECVTGRRPVEEPSIYRLISRIVGGDFAPPRQINPSVPSAFEQLVLKAMATDPDRRFPHVRALGRALLPFASERVRVSYAEELAGDEAIAPTVPLPAVSQTAEMGTTLRESVHLRESARPAEPRRSPALRALGALVGVGAVAAAIWQAARAPRPDRDSSEHVAGSASAVAATAVVAPSPVPSAAPRRVLSKTLISEPAGASVFVGDVNRGRTPLSLEVTEGAPLSVELRLAGFGSEQRVVAAADPDRIVIQLAAKPAVVRRTRADDRPELAPR